MELILHNSTKYSSDDLLKIIQFCMPPGIVEKAKKITIILKENEIWDGTAIIDDNNYKVEVVIPPPESFPDVFTVNYDFPDSYLREVYLGDTTEFIVWLLTHELFHILYRIDPKVLILRSCLKEFLEWDEETFCDVGGITNLAKYRRSI